MRRPPRIKRKRAAERRRLGFATRLRNYFIAGILVTAPISITVWLALKMVTFVDDRFRPLVPPQWNPETYLPFALPGLGIIFVLVGLSLIGFLTTGYLGRVIVKLSERLLSQVPIVSSVYGWTRQVLETVLSRDSTAFREVVLIEYPCRGSWAVGFITGQTEGEVQRLTAETVHNVFVPATPNPTTGFLLFIPERDIHRLDITVEEGIKLVISGGIVIPPTADERGRDWRSMTVTAEDQERAWRAEQAVAEGKDIKEIEAEEEARGAGLLGRFRNYLFTGTLVTAPVAITMWLAWEFIRFVDDKVTPLIPPKWNPETYLPFGIPGMGLVIAFLALTLIGFFTAGFVGRSIVRTGERILHGLPVVRGLYSALKQIFESVFKKQSQAFREVVLIEYPRPESWAIGFITGPAAEQVQQETPPNSINIFLPTTPNPTSGFLLFIPKKAAKKLSMTVEEGLKMVISGGIVTPGSDQEKTDESTPAVKDEAKPGLLGNGGALKRKPRHVG
jgi:uncharacterized membrane protein